MAKLFNTRSETIALRSLCSRDPVVSGYIMSHLDDTYFYNDESIEVLQRIQSIFNRTGSMPAFNILVEDIKLSETAREYLAEAESPVKDITQAEHLVRSLGELRKTRMFYLLARDVLDTLEKSKVDVDKLTDLVSKRISHIHAARTGEADIVHFGKDSNAWDLVKEQLYNDEHNSVIPTGFRTWDDLNGGMIRGSLCLIGGTSGGGKCSSPDTEIDVLESVSITLVNGSVVELSPTDVLYVMRDGNRMKIQAFEITEGDTVLL
jgi:replicative DNA helicase